MIKAEDEPDKEVIEKLDYIRENTHEKLKLPIAITEMIILRNLGKPFGHTVEFRDNVDKVRELPLHIIVKYAKDSYFDLAKYVVSVAKKYSLDIPVRPMGGTMDIPDMELAPQ